MGEVRRDERKGELSPGALFADRYQIEDLLGRGGMGAVYRARDPTLAGQGRAPALGVARGATRPFPAR